MLISGKLEISARSSGALWYILMVRSEAKLRVSNHEAKALKFGSLLCD